MKDLRIASKLRYTADMVSDHFTFVSREESDIGINNIGAMTGRVIVKGEAPRGKAKRYEDKSPRSTLFIKVRDEEVKNNLIALQETLIALSKDTVRVPTISKSTLIRVYVEEYIDE